MPRFKKWGICVNIADNTFIFLHMPRIDRAAAHNNPSPDKAKGREKPSSTVETREVRLGLKKDLNDLAQKEKRARESRLNEIRGQLGLKKAEDAQTMLHALVLERKVTPAKLMAVHAFLENEQQALRQELLRSQDAEERRPIQKQIESNTDLIFKIENINHAIISQGLANRPDSAAKILEDELLSGMEVKQSADQAYHGLQDEEASLTVAQEKLAEKIFELTGGKTPNEYLRDLNQGHTTALPMLGHRLKAWLGKISSTENIPTLVEEWRANSRRLEQVEANLLEMHPKPKAKTEIWRSATKPSGAEKDWQRSKRMAELEDLIELKEREASVNGFKAELLQEAADLHDEFNQIKQEREDDMAARRKRSAEQEAKQSPATKMAEEIQIINDEDVEEIEAAPRKTVPPPLSEDKLAKIREAARSRRASQEAIEVAQRTEQTEKSRAEQAAFQTRVNWAEKLLPGGQARLMSDDILGQLGKNWETADQKERQQSVDYVFKAAELQAALNARDAKAENKLTKELKALEKSIGLIHSPYLEPAGKAGYGLGIETAREEAGRVATRISGGEARNRGTFKARRARFETPVIQAVPLEEAEDALVQATTRAAEEARRAGDDRMLKASREAEKVRAEKEAKLMAGKAEAEKQISQTLVKNIEKSLGNITKRIENYNAVNESLNKSSLDFVISLAERNISEAKERGLNVAGYQEQLKTLKEKHEQLAAEPVVPEHISIQSEVGQRMFTPMTVERAAAEIPQAKELWDLATKQLKNKPEAAKALSEIKEIGQKDPATLYVLAMARYLKAVNEPATNGVIKEFLNRVNKMNKALGVQNNAMVQSIMAERGKTFGKAVGRNIKGVARQEEMRRGGGI